MTNFKLSFEPLLVLDLDLKTFVKQAKRPTVVVPGLPQTSAAVPGGVAVVEGLSTLPGELKLLELVSNASIKATVG